MTRTQTDPTKPIKVGLLAASPVYYQAPLYRRLAADPRVDFSAIFASTAGVRSGDLGFGHAIMWDVDAMGGYRSVFLKRADRNRLHRRSFFRLRDLDVVLLLLRERYDVLWLHGYYSLTHLLAAATQLLLRRPLLIREEQTLLDSRPGWKRVLKRMLLRALLRRAAALYIGTENHRWFLAHGAAPERCFLVPYCIDNERFRADARRSASATGRLELRNRFGIREESGPVIVMVARLVHKKQPLLVLEAFRRVRAQRPCTLLIVGSGELEGVIRQEIETKSIPDVVLAGFLNQSEVADAYACADIFTLPSSHDETWGLAVNEAMSIGLPVVVSDKVGCAADLVRDDVNGFVVPANDPEELAQRLGALVGDPELRRRLGAASAEIVSAWNYDAGLDGMLRAIENVVGSERWTACVAAEGSIDPDDPEVQRP